MNSDEWIPSLYTNSSIKMVDNHLDKLKKKLWDDDHLIIFFKNEILLLEINSIEIKTIIQDIKFKIIKKQSEIFNLFDLSIDNSIKIKEIELIINDFNIEVLKNDLILHQNICKINNINELIEERKINIFKSFDSIIKNYLIDNDDE
jgi:hypothetical protein